MAPRRCRRPAAAPLQCLPRVLLVVLLLVVVLGIAHAAVFTVTDDSYSTSNDTAHLKVVTNTATGEKFSVLLNGGGGVDELWLAPRAAASVAASSDFNTSLREVIWSHGRNATAVRANPTWRGRLLLPYANRIGGARYTWNGTTHHLPINDVAGLNNSLHGLLWNRSLEVVSTAADDHGGNITLAYEFNNPADATSAGPGYPFRLRVVVTYALSAAGRFDIAVAAENADVEGGWPLPFFNGWHPYFLCHPCSEASIVLDQALLPGGGSSSRSSLQSSEGGAPSSVGPWRHVDVGMGPQFPAPRHSNMVPTTHTSPWQECNGTAPIGPAVDPQSPPGAPLYMDDEVKATRPPVRDIDGAVVVGGGAVGGTWDDGGHSGPSHCAGGAESQLYYHTELRDPKTAQAVVLHHDAAMRYLQVFTGARASFPGALGTDAVVLEPLSAMSDAFNNFDGLHAVSAGEVYTSRFGVSVRSGGGGTG